MIKAPILKDEISRLKTLLDYQILETPPEADFDALVKMASKICDTPIALISLVDENRQWFKSKIGFDATEADREHSFCGHAIQTPELMVVSDATKDERFWDNPSVIGGPKVKFYAGAPLCAPNGHNIGALCVADSVAKELTEDQKELLRLLAKQAITLLEYRKLVMSMSSTFTMFHDLVQSLDHHKDELVNAEKLETLGGLASGVAHEINNPLAIIVMTAQTLKKRIENNQPAEIIMKELNIIMDTAFRMSGVVGELQKLSELRPASFMNGKTIESEFSIALEKRKKSKSA